MRLKWLKSRKYKHRIVPIHPRLKDILEIYTATLNQEDKIFPYTRQRADKIIKKHFGQEGHAHRFRHSFAVNWLRSEGDIVTLHRILGHSKIQTTMEYLKIVPIDQGKELIKIKFD
jgi:integrase